MTISELDQLRQKAKEFIANVNNAENMPEKDTKRMWNSSVHIWLHDKHVISLENDRGSSYQAYISVQNEVVATYNELRDELATKNSELNTRVE